MPGGGKALTVTTPHGIFMFSLFVAFLSVRSSQISKGEKSTHALIFSTFTPPSVVRELHNREEEEMSSTSSSRFSSDKSNGELSSRGPKLTPRPSPRLSQTPSPRPSLGNFYKSTNAITIFPLLEQNRARQQGGAITTSRSNTATQTSSRWTYWTWARRWARGPMARSTRASSSWGLT